MLYKNSVYDVYKEAYIDLRKCRTVAVLHAEAAIRSNNKKAYEQAEDMFNMLDCSLRKNYPYITLHEEFPEWPSASMRPVFSDEEINSWPTVVFSDGSTIEDTVDVPF